MSAITVWTKQHENVLKELRAAGRYTSKQRYVRADLEEHADLVIQAYDWLTRKASEHCPKPEDVTYPVWLSFSRESTMMPTPGTVILELQIPEERIIPVHISKWGGILNYSYLPLDDEDARRHRQMLRERGVDDQRAVMTAFYPDVKREIMASWERLFQNNGEWNATEYYGITWELREEWLTQQIV